MRSLSKWFKMIGSVLFILAGIWYILFPPMSSAHVYGGDWLSLLYGIVFAAGGLISAGGVLSSYVQVERYGVFMVAVAGIILSLSQLFLMLDYPVTWSRGGGVAIYTAFTVWAFERWHRLKPAEDAIREIAPEVKGG
ncbi:hypothetical protein [Brevibacterium moorei]|uniref:hypothetical protein n=1 Tax=Brevibacterium moorei TaxID=2968457 RepID=UPI00211C4ACB|nr:hypothetical protein [Brevibacterium sp. 68QC2CO]MCQ9385109.1 hypothetical protein [Brevibacterium sp. 68QC2CO]